MLEFNLRTGDALVVEPEGIGILTRQTQNYWYYFYRGCECKVSKKKLWNHIDNNTVKIKYGTNMKRRRPHRKNRTLDLHGIRHEKVDEKVRIFLNFVELPCTIITGKSEEMSSIVHRIVDEYGWRAIIMDTGNSGAMTIFEN